MRGIEIISKGYFCKGSIMETTIIDYLWMFTLIGLFVFSVYCFFVQVIEYNLRRGDPETQILLPQLQSDFYQVIVDLLQHRQPHAQWQTTATYLGVVLAAPGYPGPTEAGVPVPTVAGADYASVAGTPDQLVSAGGRVMMVTASAPSLVAAQRAVYQQIDQLRVGDLVYRTDIGVKGMTASHD